MATTFCNIFDDMNDNCFSNAGGGIKAWITNSSGFTFTENSAITHYVQSFTPGTAGIHQFVPLDDTIQFTMTNSTTNGSNSYTSTVNMSFCFSDIERRNLMMALTQTKSVLIVRDANDRYWLFGSNRPGKCNVSVDSGKAIGDASLYNLSFTFNEAYMAYGVDAAAMVSYDVD